MTIEFKIRLHAEYVPVRGNAMASGDDAFDKEVEDEIIARANDGDPWAWCTIEVVGVVKTPDGGEISSSEYLGCCSYLSQKAFMEDPYYTDMCLALKQRLGVN